MKVYIASDHAGVELKKQIIQYLNDSKLCETEDLGPFSADSVDYPDYANQVCLRLKDEPQSKAILICGSGQGMMIRANKFPFIRAALVYNDEIAQLSREHNNANVICLGARFCNLENAQKWISIFLNTHFSEGRHAVRVAKLSSPVS